MKVWYIDIQGKAEGPFTVEELKRDRRLTPDTYAWREGFDQWKPIRAIPELKDLFRDEKEPEPPPEETLRPSRPKKFGEDIVLEGGLEPPYLYWWVIAILVLLYFLLQLYLEP